MELLRTARITKSYQDRTIVRDISIHLEKQELISLLGLSGSGKTTILNIMSGLVQPDSGKVFLEDRDITGQPGQISYMLQKDLMLPHKRVIDNVALPLVIAGMRKKEAREKADPFLPGSTWRGRRCSIRARCQEGCGSAPPCCGPT